MLDLQFGGPELKSRPDRSLDLFIVVLSSNPLSMLVNTQMVCLRPVGILNPDKFDLNDLFLGFTRFH